MVPPLRFASLFTGIGAADVGLTRAGWHLACQVEIDAYCRAELYRHWPRIPKFGDIKGVTGELIRSLCGRIDAIFAGFPCQDIATQGSQLGLAGKRSGLWSEAHRLIQDLRPRWVILENVPELRCKGADAVLDGMERDGYTCRAHVVGAYAFGAKQLRNRTFIICHNYGAIEDSIGDALAGKEDVIVRGMVSSSVASRVSGPWERRSHGEECEIALASDSGEREVQRFHAAFAEMDQSAHGFGRRSSLTRAEIRKQLYHLGNGVYAPAAEFWGRCINELEAAFYYYLNPDAPRDEKPRIPTLDEGT